MSGSLTKAGPGARIQVDVRAQRTSLRLLSEIVQLYLTDALGLPHDAPAPTRIRLAVMEAVSNVVRHAYTGREPGRMGLVLERAGDDLVATLTDDAPYFAPFGGGRRGHTPLPNPVDLPTGGYGLGIIDRVMDDVRHSYDPTAGNVLTMRVAIGPPANA